MSAKLAANFFKVLAVLFTSLLAPLLVNMAERDLNGTDVKGHEPAAVHDDPYPPGSPIVQNVSPQNTITVRQSGYLPAAPIDTLHIVAEGQGKTPTDAAHDALRAALFKAIAAEMSMEARQHDGPTLTASILRDSSSLVVTWKELNAWKVWKLRGTVHHKEIAVEVNRQALVERLRNLNRPLAPSFVHPASNPAGGPRRLQLVESM
jgi:hypothetical protein